MTIESSSHIGRVIRDALVFGRNYGTGDMPNSDALIQSVQNLFSLLEQRKVDYVLVGGIALLQYIEGRNTQDLDVLMGLAALEKLPELKISSRDAYFARANFGELQIDILLTNNPLFKKVHDQYARLQKLHDREIPVATVEGLILLKLYALPSLYRQGDFARVGIFENDIATLLHDFEPKLSPLLDELSKYVDENDLGEIKTILADVQERIKRFKQKTR